MRLLQINFYNVPESKLIHWIEQEIDSHQRNPHTNQPAGLIND